ncbi:MAG TPA: DNA topoisomerase IB [Mycobacteriales bacterium]|nr:DNA topoisomerase IB [Mycobacteriales bacterium]
MTRLRRVSCAAPGLTRRRRGKGFEYLDAAGNRVTDEATVERIKSLVIPPAWEDVWICPIANGHVQATGVDARGRRQYRYHDAWRTQRDLEKHDRVLEFAARLPEARERMLVQLRSTAELTRERVLACAVRLIDVGFFRVGGEQYAEENGSYGLATLRKDHVRVLAGGVVELEFVGKSGKLWQRSVVEPEVVDVVRRLKRRRGGGPELLAYRRDALWVDVKSGDINAFLREITDTDATAKDFRTWSATVLAAVGLAVSTQAATSPTARKRAVTRVVKEVAEQMGNTPAVCRSSYIDPRVVDLYENGTTIAADLTALGADASYGEPAFQGAVEAAVLRMLREEPEDQRLAG